MNGFVIVPIKTDNYFLFALSMRSFEGGFEWFFEDFDDCFARSNVIWGIKEDFGPGNVGFSMLGAYFYFVRMPWFGLWSLLVSLYTFIAIAGTWFRFIFVSKPDHYCDETALKVCCFGWEWVIALLIVSLFIWALKLNFSSLIQRPFADTFAGLNV